MPAMSASDAPSAAAAQSHAPDAPAPGKQDFIRQIVRDDVASGKHAAILERVGATHVVRPESDMGKRVAHMVTGTMTDYIEFDDGFAIARTKTPQVACGKTLDESQLRSKHGITVVGVKTRGEDFTYARPETSITQSDELIVSGPTNKVEAFCALP